MLTYQSKKIKDNSPDIRAAGKLIPRDHGLGECLVHNSGGRVTPNNVKQIRSSVRPEVGTSWTLSRRMGEFPVDASISHGKPSRSSESAELAVCPPLLSKFQQAVLDRTEGHYHSRKNYHLGAIHDQTDALPEGMDITTTTFGKKILREESVGKTVNPPKSMDQVDIEYYEKRDLYKKSHNTWDVGEIIDRDYDWSKFTKGSLYGVPTPHDNTGKQTKKAMHWLQSIDGRVIAQKLDEFREKYQSQVGKVLDPIAETMNVPPDHTFGVTVQPDDLSAGDLLHMEGDTVFSQCLMLDEGVLTVIRNVLKKNNFHNFNYLLDALHNLDKGKSGVLPKDVIRDVSFQFGLPLGSDMLEMLMHWCTVKYDEHRNLAAYEEIVLLMDWKTPVQYNRLVHSKVPMPLARDSYISLATADTTKPNMALLKSYMPKMATPLTKSPAPCTHADEGGEGKSETSRSAKDETATPRSTMPRSDIPKSPQESSEQQHTTLANSKPQSAKSVTATPTQQKARFQDTTPRTPSTPAHRECSSSDDTVSGSSTGRTSKHEATPTGDAMVTPVTAAVPSVVSQGLLPNYRTSSQSYRATSGAIPTEHLRSYGVPTIRSDLAAPRIKRVSDNKNYGDESNSYNILYPSIYANHGVFESDFFEARTKDQLCRIFEGMDIHIPEEVFEELWAEAAKRNSKGEVSVEGFREAIHDMQQLQGTTATQQQS